MGQIGVYKGRSGGGEEREGVNERTAGGGACRQRERGARLFCRAFGRRGGGEEKEERRQAARHRESKGVGGERGVSAKWHRCFVELRTMGR
eukprot:scaffold58799_cov28-Tisochrysis_lutea.AAC.3